MYTIFIFNSVFYRSTSQEAYDSDLMAKEFLMQFAGMALTVGQTLVFSFQDKKLLGLAVKTLEGKYTTKTAVKLVISFKYIYKAYFLQNIGS